MRRYDIDILFILLWVFLLNIIPLDIALTGDLAQALTTENLAFIITYYVKAIYIESYMLITVNPRLSRLSAIRILRASAIKTFPALLIVLAIPAVVIAAVLYHVMSGDITAATIASWISGAIGILLDIAAVPYILYRAAVGSDAPWYKGLISSIVFLGIPWLLVSAVIVSSVNYFIAYVIGHKLIYPYFLPLSSKAMEKIAAGHNLPPLPTYGDLVAAPVIARYSAWIVEKMKRRP